MELSIPYLANAWATHKPGTTQQPDLPPLTHTALAYALLLDQCTASAQSQHPTSTTQSDTMPVTADSTASTNTGTDARTADVGSTNQQLAQYSSKEKIHSGPSVASSALYERVLQLAWYRLERAARRVEPDALTPTAQCVRVALGPTHPVAVEMQSLAERNMSSASRLRAEQRKQQVRACVCVCVCARMCVLCVCVCV